MRGPKVPVGLAALVAVIALLASGCVLNGTWTAIEPFDPVPATRTNVNDVACLSATDCLVVGSESAPTGGQPTPLVQRFDGTGWTALPVPPTPAGATFAVPMKISCGSATACGVTLAVRVGTAFQGRFARWDGTSWNLVPLTTVVPAQLDHVACVADGSCVFTSSGGATVTWDGSAYASVVPFSTPALDGLSCTALDHCVGVAMNPETYHFDGSSWTSADGPSLPGRVTRFAEVHCFATDDCLAAGTDYPSGMGTGDALPAAGRWNGTSWTITPLPAGTGVLDGLSCASSIACVAVGFDGEPSYPIAFGWNGGDWYSIAAPPSDGPYARYRSIGCAAGDACLAVGSRYSVPLASNVPLVARYQWTSS